jgi:AcrR family transcriptional regulator
MESTLRHAVNDAPVESGGRKPKGRGHERREEILAAAVRLFVEHGFENVSTRRIADALGISQTTLYVYFPTKDAILEALCDDCFAGLVASFREVQARPGDRVVKLRELMHAYVRFGVEHSDQYRIAFMTPHHHSQEKAALFNAPAAEQPTGIQCFHLLQGQIQALADSGDLRFDPQIVAQCLWAAGHGLVSLLITMPLFPWADRDVLIDRLLEIQLGGVLAVRR